LRRKEKEIKDRMELAEIIEQGKICRLGLSQNNVPYIVPMNYGFIGNNLYFHSAKDGKKLDIIKKNNYACFEIEIETKIIKAEKACNWGMRYKSIIGYGHIEEVSERKEKKYGLLSLMRQYDKNRDWIFDDDGFNKTLVLKLTIEQMSGKTSGY